MRMFPDIETQFPTRNSAFRVRSFQVLPIVEDLDAQRIGPSSIKPIHWPPTPSSPPQQ